MIQKTQGPRFVRVGVRATELGVHRTTLQKWVKTGRIKPPIQLAPKTAGWWEGDENFWIVQPSAQAKGAAERAPIALDSGNEKRSPE